MARRNGWARIGERAFGAVPLSSDPNITLVMGLRLRGVVAPFAFEGAMNGPTFRTYVQHELAPQLHAGDLVLADGLGAHRTEGVRQAIERRGARYRLLPPYSPDLSPVEQAGSKIKQAVRSEEPRTPAAVYDAMGRAIGTVTRVDARGWFEHAGYVRPRQVRRRLRPGARYYARRPPPLLLARGRTSHGEHRTPPRRTKPGPNLL